MIVYLPDVGQGINLEIASGDLPIGVWNNCANFRFFNGYASKFEGAYALPNGGTTTVQYRWVAPYATPVASGSIPVTRYAVGLGIARGFSNNGSAETEITRYTAGVAISSITRAGTTATLTTGSNHGLSTGNTVSIWGATPSQYNGTYVITVTGVTTWTYTMASDPGASATVTVAAYSNNQSTANFTGGVSDQWTGGNLGGIMLANNPVNGLYFWDGTGRMKLVPGSYVAYSTRVFKQFAMQIGPTVNGTALPWSVAWSNITDPGQIPTFTTGNGFEANVTSLAETPGAGVDGLPIGDVFAVYKTDSIYTFQRIDSPLVFNIQRIPGEDGLLARNCVVDTPAGHVFLSQKRDVRIFDGQRTRSIADGRVGGYLRYFMDKAKDHCAFVCSNPSYTEVWICFHDNITSSANDACNRALVWNWEHDTWGMFEFIASGWPMPTHAVSGTWPSGFQAASPLINGQLVGGDLLIATHDSKVGISTVGSGGTYFGNTIYGWLQRHGLTFNKECKASAIRRSRWNIVPASSQSVDVYHGAVDFFGTAPTFPGGYQTANYQPGTTEWVDATSISGKYSSIYLYFNATTQQSLRSGFLDISEDGAR
jgi:hypothetical protein